GGARSHRSPPDSLPRRRHSPMRILAARGRLFRKYVAVLILLVGGMLLLSSVVNLYFFYRETKAALIRLQRQQALISRGQPHRAVREGHREAGESGHGGPVHRCRNGARAARDCFPSAPPRRAPPLPSSSSSMQRARCSSSCPGSHRTRSA